MIHYHGTPLGGTVDDCAAFFRGRHAFVPWSYTSQLTIVAEVARTFAIDNGAFTHWKKGEKQPDWGMYYEFVSEWSRHPGFDFAVIPDVIDGDERDNDELLQCWTEMIGRHARSIGAPVWHMHERISRLSTLAATWPRVCIGSSGEYADVGTERWSERMADAMTAVCHGGRPMCKLHGLRMLNPAVFTRYPLSSADSTNVAQNSGREAARLRCSPKAAREIMASRIESQQSSDSWSGALEHQGMLWD